MSFMKPLAGPLAGAATAMIPGAGPMLAPIVSSAVGSAMARSPNSQGLGPVTQGMQAGYNMASSMGSQAAQAYSPVIDYWSRMLSPNRGVAMSALAPEIARMGDQNTAEMRAAATLTPRGGPSTSFMGQLPFQQMQNVQGLFQGLRPQAAGQLGGLAGNLMTNSLNALNMSTAAGRTVMDYQLQKNMQDMIAGRMMGGAAADAFKNVDFSKLLNLGRSQTTLPAINFPSVPGGSVPGGHITSQPQTIGRGLPPF